MGTLLTTYLPSVVGLCVKRDNCAIVYSPLFSVGILELFEHFVFDGISYALFLWAENRKKGLYKNTRYMIGATLS